MVPFALAPRITKLTLSPQLLTPQGASYKALFPTHLWPSQGKSGGFRGTAFPGGRVGFWRLGVVCSWVQRSRTWQDHLGTPPCPCLQLVLLKLWPDFPPRPPPVLRINGEGGWLPPPPRVPSVPWGWG